MYRAHAPPLGTCENLVNAIKLLADQQKDGGSPVVQGFQEKSRLQMMDGLRRFIMVDNYGAVKGGDLEKNMVSRTVVKLNFTTKRLEAMVREGAGELTLRREEACLLRTIIDTTSVGDSRLGPPLADVDWHAVCQAI